MVRQSLGEFQQELSGAIRERVLVEENNVLLRAQYDECAADNKVLRSQAGDLQVSYQECRCLLQVCVRVSHNGWKGCCFLLREVCSHIQTLFYSVVEIIWQIHHVCHCYH